MLTLNFKTKEKQKKVNIDRYVTVCDGAEFKNELMGVIVYF
jgi:hypothetical protein